jgi:hypothetical protein
MKGALDRVVYPVLKDPLYEVILEPDTKTSL